MSNCDICSINITTSSKRFFSNDFKKIIQNGFNPFKEDITYPTGLRLSEMGAAMGLSSEDQYSQWKAKAMVDNSDWILCPQCSPYADNYKR